MEFFDISDSAELFLKSISNIQTREAYKSAIRWLRKYEIKYNKFFFSSLRKN